MDHVNKSTFSNDTGIPWARAEVIRAENTEAFEQATPLYFNAMRPVQQSEAGRSVGHQVALMTEPENKKLNQEGARLSGALSANYDPKTDLLDSKTPSFDQRKSLPKFELIPIMSRPVKPSHRMTYHSTWADKIKQEGSGFSFLKHRSEGYRDHWFTPDRYEVQKIFLAHDEGLTPGHLWAETKFGYRPQEVEYKITRSESGQLLAKDYSRATVSGAYHQGVDIFNQDNEKVLTVPHASLLYQCEFSHDSNMLASIDARGGLKLTNISTGRTEILEPSAPSAACRTNPSLFFSDDNQVLAAFHSEGVIRVFDLKEKQKISEIHLGHRAHASNSQVKVNDDKTMVMKSAGNLLSFYDLSGKVLCQHRFDSRINDFKLDQNGEKVMVALDDAVALLKLKRNSAERVNQASSFSNAEFNSVYKNKAHVLNSQPGLRISSDSKYFYFHHSKWVGRAGWYTQHATLTCNRHKERNQFKMKKGKFESSHYSEIRRYGDELLSNNHSYSSYVGTSRKAYASNDHAIYVKNGVGNYRKDLTTILHPYKVSHYSYSPQSRNIASVDRSGCVKLTDLMDHNNSRTLMPSHAQEDEPIIAASFDFSKDESTLAMVTNRGEVTLMNTSSRDRKVLDLRRYLSGWQHQIKLADNQEMFMVASDNTLRFFDLEGKLQYQKQFDFKIEDFVLSDCGKFLFLSSGHHVEVFEDQSYSF